MGASSEVHYSVISFNECFQSASSVSESAGDGVVGWLEEGEDGGLRVWVVGEEVDGVEGVSGC